MTEYCGFTGSSYLLFPIQLQHSTIFGKIEQAEEDILHLSSSALPFSFVAMRNVF
jgi:hypothetical protein